MGVTGPDRLDPAVQEAAGARFALLAAYRAAVRAVEALPGRAAFAAATALAETLRDLAEDAAWLRSRMARRVAREEQLTVRALAEALGMSRTAASVQMTRGRRGRTGSGPGSPVEGEAGAAGSAAGSDAAGRDDPAGQ